MRNEDQKLDITPQNDIWERIEIAGTACSEHTLRLILACQEVAGRILCSAQVETGLPRGYSIEMIPLIEDIPEGLEIARVPAFLCLEESGLFVICFKDDSNQEDHTNFRLPEGLEFINEAVALRFAMDVKTGLLTEIAEFLEMTAVLAIDLHEYTLHEHSNLCKPVDHLFGKKL